MIDIVSKACLGFCVLLIIGLPVLQTHAALLLAASVFAVVLGSTRQGRWRWAAAAGVVVAVLAVKTVLPRADISEGHNAFLVIREGEALQQGLPPEIFASWKKTFDSLYPPDHEPFSPRSQWRTSATPAAVFTRSSDAIWRHAKYTRQIDGIDFGSLGEFRGGFANEPQYNFWEGELRRESMPFFVMYELSPASVGSSLTWKGQVFWQRADGGFDEINHDQIATRTIIPLDSGRRVYAAFFPPPGLPLTRTADFTFRMTPSPKLRMAAWFRLLISIAGVVAIVALGVRVRWREYLHALAIFGAAYALLAAFNAAGIGRYLGQAYPPHGGGDDGLVHDGWGRVMAMVAAQGHLIESLKGNEAVYWFTPGTRYVRMVEKLIFGDTNLLWALLIACVPVILFYLIRHFVGQRWAWIATAAFLMMPAGNFSFLQYLANAKLGYGEAIGGGLFLCGLVALLHTQPTWGGIDRNRALVMAGGAMMAASMFIRPNFALAVIWLGAAYAWASWKHRDHWSIIALGVGLGLALWMPFHNWYYGGELYLISKSGATVSLSLGPLDYFSAIRDVLRGDRDTAVVQATLGHIKGWLGGPGFFVVPRLRPLAWATHIVRLAAMGVTCWVAVTWVLGRRPNDTGLAVIAIASLCAQIPMLFIFATLDRYAMLGWDLAIVVMIVWVAQQWRSRAVGRLNVSPV